MVDTGLPVQFEQRDGNRRFPFLKQTDRMFISEQIGKKKLYVAGLNGIVQFCDKQGSIWIIMKTAGQFISGNRRDRRVLKEGERGGEMRVEQTEARHDGHRQVFRLLMKQGTHRPV